MRYFDAVESGGAFFWMYAWFWATSWKTMVLAVWESHV